MSEKASEKYIAPTEEVFIEKALTNEPESSSSNQKRLSSRIPPNEMFPNIDEKKVLRKMDLHLIPVVSILYLLAFLDRGNIGNAKLEGLIEDLNLTGDKYNVCLTIFFVTYTLCEIPLNMMLKRIRPSIWLPSIMVAWGIVMTLMGVVHNYMGLFFCRLFLGMAEAGLFPGISFMLTKYYCRHEINYRQSIFFSLASIAGAFSGILAFGIGKMNGVGGYAGWRWIFILEGLVTVIVAVAAFFWVPDFPDTVPFLNEEERQFVLYRLEHDSNNDAVSFGNGDHSSSFFEAEVKDTKLKYVWQAFKDCQVYMHTCVYIGLMVPLYATSLFLPTIIKGLGYTSAKAQLMSVPIYVAAAILSVVQLILSDKVGKRSPFLTFNYVTMLAGFIVAITCDPISKPGAIYAGVFIATIGVYQAVPTAICWLANNVAGDYKRAVAMAIHIGFGNFGGMVPSNAYRAVDSPHYKLGHALTLGFIGLGLVSTILVTAYYKKTNVKRENDILEGKFKHHNSTQLAEMGDKNPYFRYRI